MRVERRVIEAAILDVEQARNQFGHQAGFRTRTLFNMLLLEIGKELTFEPSNDPVVLKQSDIVDGQ